MQKLSDATASTKLPIGILKNEPQKAPNPSIHYVKSTKTPPFALQLAMDCKL
jgi:hypothetical protein